MKKLYKADVAELENLLGDFEFFCEERGVNPAIIMSLTLCLDELFTNIASYAYGDKEGDVEFFLDIGGGEITASLSDRGQPFNPLTDAKNPDMTSPVESREIGGLGVYLVKKNVDSISYKNENGKNILTFKKKI